MVKEGAAEAVKLEVNPKQLDCVSGIIDSGIPVMAHIGFTPQSVHQLGGYKIQGKGEAAANEMIDLAKELETMGAFAILLEMVPKSVSQRIHAAVSIPVIGIGAGPHVDGQVLVSHDLLGLSDGFVPRFVKQYASIGQTIKDAFKSFKEDVNSQEFPSSEHSF